MRKLGVCLCENKDADQLRRNCEADQRLYSRYLDSTIHFPLISKFQACSHLLRLYRLVCVKPDRKPRRPVFSQRLILDMLPINLFTIFALSAGFQRSKINNGNTGNQNHPDLKVRVVLVTCIFNIDLSKLETSHNAKMVNCVGYSWLRELN